MHRRSIQIVTAAALATFAGQAIGQQHLSPSDGRRLAHMLEDSDKSLTDAVRLAERETGGKALEARIITARDLQRIYDDAGQRGAWPDARQPGDGDREFDRDRDLERERNRDMDRDRDTDRQPADRQGENRDRLTSGQDRGLHASVICLVNQNQLRRVIVDLKEGRVVESRALGARHFGEQRQDQTSDRSTAAPRDGQMHLASNLLNCNVVTAADDDLGDIDDLALDVSNGQVRYAVLRTGGFLGMGGDRHAVPLDSLMFVGDDKVRVNVTEEQLEQREGFDDDRWPHQPSGAWGATGQRQTTQRQGEDQNQPGERQPQVQRPGQPTETGQRQASGAGTVEKASDVIGATVHGAGEASVGDVDDFIIKGSESKIGYYIISTDDGKVAVPASKIRMVERRLTLSMDAQEFEQLPKFRDNENPDWTNPQWLEDLGDRFDDDRDSERDPNRRGG